MRGNSIRVLGEDYVRVARLRGLSDRRISTRYVARNAILPMYTGFLMLIGYNLGGSIILEQVFSYRGMGWYMFDALENADYSLMMGTFMVYAVALVLAVFIADLTYSKVDPRVKTGDSSEAY
jgi:peptide/nickel transport system permease protein